jgi:hypothetical protein
VKIIALTESWFLSLLSRIIWAKLRRIPNSFAFLISNALLAEISRSEFINELKKGIIQGRKLSAP